MAIQAQLKGLSSLDRPDGHWEEWRPEDPECFAFRVTAEIGPAGEQSRELFRFTVCTPGWVAAKERLPKGFAFARYLLVSRWDPRLVERALEDLCRRTNGDTWSEVGWQLARYAHWEFEDYRPKG